MNSLSESFEAKNSFSHLLELAADNDVEGFKHYIESNPNGIDEIGLWYGRNVGAPGMVLEHRTPLMVASMYGSLDVMKVILSLSEADVNRSCSPDNITALHCAASNGSVDAVDAVKLLLGNGADPYLCDAKGNRPYDAINVSQILPQVRVALEDLLNCHGSTELKVDSLSIPILSETESMPSSPMASKCNDTNAPPVSEKKEYPIDPSLPDIKNSIFATDEFRMYTFKVRPCSRAYSHDWTECPFVHPGENARRRDPRKYHYSCVPCPDFRKGSCRRGDMCEYAHGVFECWLHPAQYRTRLCKDGTGCNRRVCFFAHIPEELRPLYASTGSAVPSPRSMTSAAAVMDMAAALNIFPGSPSAVSGMMSPSSFTPPMSPSANGMPSPWQQQQNMNIPTLHLPGSNIIQANNLQTSRLRSSLNARDIASGDLSILHDLDSGHRHLSHPQFKSNLDELFSMEVSSPRYTDQLPTPSVFSPSHRTAVLNHFQQQQSMLSPINTNHPFLQPSFGPSSPGVISPRGIEPHSPLSARVSALSLRSLSGRDLGANLPGDLIPESAAMVGSSVGSWSKWESTNGKPDWSMKGDELNRLKRSLVKDSPSGNKEVQNNGVIGTQLCGDGSNSNSQVESVDHSALGAWLDQIAAQ